MVRLEVVSAMHMPDRRAMQRFLTALRALKRIDHPCLPKILEVGTLPDGRPWAAMEELVDAVVLAEMISDGPMTVVELWPIVSHVLDGLEVLHKTGFIHGDIKVENVLVKKLVAREPSAEGEEAPATKDDFEVLLIGMGSDRLFSRPTRDDREAGPLTGAGTPKCMAPEQARGKGIDRRTDLYQLGSMLYELLTKRTMFHGRSGIDVVAKQLHDDPKAPSFSAPKGAVPAELDKFILELLHKDALRRPKDIPAIRPRLAKIAEAALEAATEPGGTVEEAQAIADLFIETPEEEGLADTLEAAAKAARSWMVASEAYEMVLETVDDEEILKDVRLRLARVLGEELDDAEGAEAHFDTLIEKYPDDPDVDAALEALKRKAGKFDDVIEMLLQRIQKAEEPGDKVAAMREVARIYEAESDQPERAFTVLLAALQFAQDEELLEDLARLAGSTGQWNDLVQSCSQVVQNVQEPTKRVLVTTLMGQWYGEKLGRQDYALPCFQQALAMDPSNDRALRGMEEIFRRQQQWLELAQVLLTRADAARYPSDKRDRLAEAADIFDERLSDHGRAVELFRKVLDDDPAHAGSVEALERIYQRTKSWPELIELYQSKDEALTDGAEKAETRYFVGEVYEDHLSNNDKAIEAYKGVLEIEPRHIPTLKGLERLYAMTGAYKELLENLEVQVGIAATPRQRVTFLQRRAQILEEEFVEREAAIDEYAKLLEIEPSHEDGLTAVGRLQRTLERWEDLDVTYARHITATEDDQRKSRLLRERATLLIDKLDDNSKAAEVLSELAEILPDDRDVIDGLSKQRLIAGDAEGAVKALERLAEITEEPTAKAQVWVRVGELQERKLENHEQAEAAYRKALDADKGNVIAAAALQESYAEKGDMTAALDMLERQLDAASGDLEKSRIYTQMGLVCREKLGEPQRAVDYFESALECDKSNADAAEPLAEIHRDAGRWDAAVAIYDRFADATAAMPPEKKIEFFTAWGDSCVQLEDLGKATKAFESARDVAPDNTAVTTKLADVHFKSEKWDKAAECYANVLDKAADALDPPTQTELYLHLGIAAEKKGDLEAAGAALNSVLELNPINEPALRHRANVHIAAQEFEDAVQVLERLVDATEAPEEKSKILTELGDIYGTELVEPEKAAKALSSALSNSPDNRNLLMRLMKAYNATEQWSNLVEVVLQIADLESNTVKVAKYYHSAAMIAHQKLGRADEAREYYEMAIEQDPSLISSFEALAEILTEKEEWEELSSVYQKMLERLPKGADDATKVKMLDALGGVLQNQLEKPEEAVEYYEKAHELDPEDRPRKETLARLYGDKPQNASKAIGLHHQLLSLNPFRAESYRALRQIYGSTKQWDQQWCCARTLVALHMADEEEEQLFKTYRTEEIPPPGDCLSHEHWQNYLLHRDQSRRITDIFETILGAVLHTQARPHKAFGVDPSQVRNLDTDDHPFSGLVRFAAGTLGIEPPHVFFKEDQEATAFVIQTNPPAILAGALALNAAYENPRALAYVVGRHLAYSHGGNFLRVLLESGTMMRAWLLAALKHIVPKIPVPSDMAGMVSSCSGKLTQNLGPAENEALRTQVLSFIDSAAKVDLKQWGMAVDFTSDRVGFLLCDDLEIASQLIRLEKGSATPIKDRLKELNLFSVSPEYFTLRQKLLIQLRVDE